MRKIYYLLLCIILLSTTPAMAITEVDKQNIMKSDPGRIDALRLDELKKKQQEKKNKKTKAPNFDALKKNAEIKKVENTPLFTLRKVVFEGNTVIETETLDKIATDYVDKEITVNDLLELTKKVTDLYQEEGYITSMAFLPPQKIKKGIVRIELLEGKIGKINVSGNKWYKTRYLKNNILKSNDIKNNNVFNVSDLRASLQEINTKDHLKGRVIIDESEDPEFADISLEVEDRFPLNINLGYNNQGRQLIGRQMATATISNDNLTGYGDQLYASTAIANGTFGLNSGYSIPLGTEGTRLGFDYSYSNVNIGGPDLKLKSNDIRGFSHNYSIGLTRPLKRTDDFKLYGRLAFDLRDARTYQKQNNVGLLSKYNLRVLRAGLNAVKDDFNGRWYLGSTVSTGIPLFGGTERTFDYGEYGNNIGTNKFVKMDANITRLQILPRKSLGILKLSGQWATRRLNAAEQFQIGGIGTVRGYEEGFIIGDWGVVTSAEIRTPVPFLGKVLPKKLAFINDNIKWANFCDFGYVDNMHRGIGAYTNLLVGVGSGLNIKLTKYLTSNVYVGIPLGHQKRGSNNINYDGQAARLHFNITSDVF